MGNLFLQVHTDDISLEFYFDIKQGCFPQTHIKAKPTVPSHAALRVEEVTSCWYI